MRCLFALAEPEAFEILGTSLGPAQSIFPLKVSDLHGAGHPPPQEPGARDFGEGVDLQPGSPLNYDFTELWCISAANWALCHPWRESYTTRYTYRSASVRGCMPLSSLPSRWRFCVCVQSVFCDI
ncbi:hypothetical protein AK812_SmicGene17097 [Symbiodinium microadriaticum]|uniref:Uncharacterized protein n=1 Tax=Symbiodinium microadriaticum TaxID=2951 RepID=A0A1Q9DYI1_SYMMI|nr:hypothetical protein AK812_SmicGene17097 [Symbiodinium microadriaticum]